MKFKIWNIYEIQGNEVSLVDRNTRLIIYVEHCKIYLNTRKRQMESPPIFSRTPKGRLSDIQVSMT